MFMDCHMVVKVLMNLSNPTPNNISDIEWMEAFINHSVRVRVSAYECVHVALFLCTSSCLIVRRMFR